VNRRRVTLFCIVAGLVAPAVAAVSFPTVSYAASNPTLSRGSHGSAVKTLQTDLKSVGYGVGTIDGIFGPKTFGAVKKFQAAHHLTTNGVVMSSTWTALTSAVKSNSNKSPKSSSPNTSSSTSAPKGSASSSTKTATSVPYPGKSLRLKSRGTPVKEVQQKLNQLGYKAGAADGIYGVQTAAAVKRFQKAHRLTVDGIVGQQSWSILFAKTTPSGASSRNTNPVMTYQAFKANGQLVGTYTSVTAAESALTNIPGGYVKNSNGTTIWQQHDYVVYDGSGRKLDETTDMSKAESDLKAVPMGVVRDASQHNAVVFTQSDVYAAYVTPDGAPIDTTSLQSAINAIHGTDVGFVIDLGRGTLAQQPADYFFLNGSHHWLHHLQGVTISTGNAVPSWAKVGSTYVARDTASPPFYYDYYEIANVAAPVHAGTFENPFRSVDLRTNAPSSINPTAINSWLTSVNSPLAGLGSNFLQAQQDYGVDAAYLAGHAFQETGTAGSWTANSIPVLKNNVFGYGAYTSNPAAAAYFPSTGYAIEFEGWYVRQNYLTPGASYYYNWPTLDGMNKNYATDSNWSSDIAEYMDDLATSAGASISEFTTYQSNTAASARAAANSVEPTYLLPSGAQGTLTGTGSSVTAYSDYQMRPTLNIGTSGDWVKEMQSDLNDSHMAGTTIAEDGDFGTGTLSALKTFQASAHLGQDGICGPATWQALVLASQEVHTLAIPSGSQVNVLAVRMGDSLTNWYYVSTAGNPLQAGWVPATNIALTNVYQVVPASAPSKAGYSVTLADGSVLRGGDDVVYAKSTGSVSYAASENFTASGQPVAAPTRTSTLTSGSVRQVIH